MSTIESVMHAEYELNAAIEELNAAQVFAKSKSFAGMSMALEDAATVNEEKAKETFWQKIKRWLSTFWDFITRKNKKAAEVVKEKQEKAEEAAEAATEAKVDTAALAEAINQKFGQDRFLFTVYKKDAWGSDNLSNIVDYVKNIATISASIAAHVDKLTQTVAKGAPASQELQKLSDSRGASIGEKLEAMGAAPSSPMKFTGNVEKFAETVSSMLNNITPHTNAIVKNSSSFEKLSTETNNAMAKAMYEKDTAYAQLLQGIIVKDITEISTQFGRINSMAKLALEFAEQASLLVTAKA